MKQQLFHTLAIIAATLLLGIFFFPAAQRATARPLGFQSMRQNGISEPRSGDTLAGIVVVRGTATHENFLRYELAFNRAGEWLVFAEGAQPVVDGTLAIWDTTVGRPTSPVFPDGLYQLRLRVVRQDYNYDEYFVRDLVVANEDVTPTPVVTATVGTTTPTPGATTGATPVETQPSLLPSLTPFPTPSPQATAASVILPGDPGAGQPELSPDEREGLLQRLLALDTGRVVAAFWQGARLALIPFALLAVYLLVRGALRRLWRIALSRWQDGRRDRL